MGHVPGPRSLEQRIADARVILSAVHTDVWVASASADGQAHLVPLSFAWDGVDVFLAMEADAVTTRNVLRGGRSPRLRSHERRRDGRCRAGRVVSRS
jgi:hypothetical protein